MHRSSLPLSVFALALCLPAGPASAAPLSVDASRTEVTYHVSHPGKEFDGRLSDGGAKATLRLDPADLASIRLRATIDVARFDSQNQRRDSHMLEVMEAFLFPTIEWTVESVSGVSGPVAAGTYELRARGPLKMHGLEQPFEAPVTLRIEDTGTITATSEFVVSLDAWKIERPSLLFVKIDDEVPVAVRMTFPAPAADLFAPPPPPTPSVPPTEQEPPEPASP